MKNLKLKLQKHWPDRDTREMLMHVLNVLLQAHHVAKIYGWNIIHWLS